VFLATGNNFADALSAGPAAASVDGSVLLTAGPTLPPSVATYLQGLSSPTVYAVGQAAHLADPSAKAIVGGDRFATAALVSANFFTDPTTVGVATGLNFPDALAGGAFMGYEGGPILLTQPLALRSADGLYIGEHSATLQQSCPTCVHPPVSRNTDAALVGNSSANGGVADACPTPVSKSTRLKPWIEGLCPTTASESTSGETECTAASKSSIVLSYTR
jgi:hypothetical protein